MIKFAGAVAVTIIATVGIVVTAKAIWATLRYLAFRRRELDHQLNGRSLQGPRRGPSRQPVADRPHHGGEVERHPAHHDPAQRDGPASEPHASGAVEAWPKREGTTAPSLLPLSRIVR